MAQDVFVAYVNSAFPSVVEELKNFVRIPSISFKGFDPKTLDTSAQAVADYFRRIGLENVELLTVDGSPPYVYADWLHAPGKPTLLLYAHHDVQPPGQIPKWLSKPFEPVERDGRLFGRGAADDKAGIVVHGAAIEAFLKTKGKLPLNVKLIIEGEEEVGSGHLEGFLERYKNKMQADVIVLTDTGNFDTGIPTITTSLRGLVAAEVEVSVMRQSVHSGMWGGGVPDPAVALAKMIASLVDENGRIAIPGIYDKVRPLTPIEQKSIDNLDYKDADYANHLGLKPGVKITGGKESPLVKITRLPSIAVNAIEVSTRAGVANVVNASAWCKVGIRIVPDMDPGAVEKSLIAHLKKNAPWGVNVEIHSDTAKWWISEPTHPAFAVAKESLEKAFGRECVYLGTGGSIPFVEPFSNVLGGAPALLIGVEDPYTNAHSENESVHLGDLKKSILGAIYFYEQMAEA